MSSILAKAMNSSLGSGEFVAFDKLLYRQKIIVPSENYYCSLCGLKVNDKEAGSVSTDIDGGVQYREKELASFEMLTSGSFNLKTTCSVEGKYVPDNVQSDIVLRFALAVYKGQERIVWAYQDETVEIGQNALSKKNIDISISNIDVLAGDNIRLVLYVSTTNLNSQMNAVMTLASPIQIYAEMKDSAFEIL